MTHNIPTELQRYVQERIIPQYAGFDKAHQIDHAEKVIEESLKLALHYEVDSAMVYTVAAYHDLGLCEGREFHHIVSGRILLADEISDMLLMNLVNQGTSILESIYDEGGF